jgi:hypothetical protein
MSSHLGDEYLLNPDPPGGPVERINLSYEVIELLGSYERRGLRAYGGVSKVFHSDTPFERSKAQLGFEYSGRILDWRSARPAAGIDLQSWEETDWDVDVSIKAGIRVRSPYGGPRSVYFLLEFYHGHAPFGQFYPLKIRQYGFGIAFYL